MALLSRKKPAEADTDSPSVADDLADRKGPGAKGRATPKRSAAIKARPVTPYMKSATGGTKKERAREARAERGGSMSAARAALKGNGDPSLLPLRDKPAERGLARSVVDGRRNLTTFVFMIYVLFLVASLTHGAVKAGAFAAMFVGLLIIIGDGFLLGRLVRGAVREAYPDSKVKVTFYAFQRSLLPTRFRLPKPGVGVPTARTSLKKRA